MLGIVPDVFSTIASASIAIVVVWDLVWHPEIEAAVLSKVCRDIDRLEAEHRVLWEGVAAGHIEDEEAYRQLSTIHRMLRYIAADIAKIGTNESLDQKCTEEAYQAEAVRYAV